MPTLVEVWESRLGVTEVPGPGKNATISAWCKDVGHPELSDNDAWCSISMSSVAKDAGYPYPPPNINPMARSWLTMGVTVKPEDVQPNDVIVWPRGAPGSGKGHVNCVKEVKRLKTKTMVRCIGGNQGQLGAVTETDWVDLKGALPNGIRRLVPITIKDLRDAGSTEIAHADNLEKAVLVGGPSVVGIAEAAQSATAPISSTPVIDPAVVEQIKTGAEVGSAAQNMAEAGHAIGALFMANIWIPVVAVGCFGIWWFIIRPMKKARLARHAAGAPLSSEVANLNSVPAFTSVLAG